VAWLATHPAVQQVSNLPHASPSNPYKRFDRHFCFPLVAPEGGKS
jgi:hypothetical protein